MRASGRLLRSLSQAWDLRESGLSSCQCPRRGVGAAEVRRSLVESNYDTGLFAGADSTILVADTVVRDTLPRVYDERAGKGMQLQQRSVGTVSRVLLHDNWTSAATASSGASIDVEDVTARDILAAPGNGELALGHQHRWRGHLRRATGRHRAHSQHGLLPRR